MKLFTKKYYFEKPIYFATAQINFKTKIIYE